MSKRKRFFDTAFGRTLTGRNKTGQLVAGVVDILPIPNFMNLLRGFVDDKPDATLWEAVTGGLSRGDLLRYAISIPLAILVLTGRVSLEDIGKLFDLIGKITALLGG